MSAVLSDSAFSNSVSILQGAQQSSDDIESLEGFPGFDDSLLKHWHQRLATHELFGKIKTVEHLRLFMSHHVVCVWDFMTLVKLLQQNLTGTALPWIPQNAEIARFINEIVLEEETSLELAKDRNGKPISHFEWYVQAMAQVGADTEAIETFITLWREAQAKGEVTADNLIVRLAGIYRESGLPEAAYAHCEYTLSLAQQPLAVQAIVFYYSRENLIPDMFTELVDSLSEQGLKCELLMSYLNTHITCDGDTHGPLAQKLLSKALEANTLPPEQLMILTTKALSLREKLWTKIAEQLSD